MGATKKRGAKKGGAKKMRQKTIYESLKVSAPKKKAGRPKGSHAKTKTIHASQPLIKIVCDCKKS